MELYSTVDSGRGRRGRWQTARAGERMCLSEVRDAEQSPRSSVSRDDRQSGEENTSLREEPGASATCMHTAGTRYPSKHRRHRMLAKTSTIPTTACPCYYTPPRPAPSQPLSTLPQARGHRPGMVLTVPSPATPQFVQPEPRPTWFHFDIAINTHELSHAHSHP